MEIIANTDICREKKIVNFQARKLFFIESLNIMNTDQ